VPTGKGVLVFTNAPEREMLVTYSSMNWANESNSLLIVTRSFFRASFIVASVFVRTV